MCFDVIYLEAGSGASKTIDPQVIRTARKILSKPIIAGGGINTVNKAEKLLEAGADFIVTGNAIEKKPAVFVDKKEDLPINKIPDPILAKTENIKPVGPSIETNKKEPEIKNDDPSIIIDKPKPTVVKEEVVVKNRLIPNNHLLAY